MGRDRIDGASRSSHDEREQTRVFQGGRTVADARQVLPSGGECQEGSDARLADEERSVPTFVARADEEVAAASVEEDLAAGSPEQRQRVSDVELIRRLTRDRMVRGEIRRGRVVGDGTKAE